MGRVKFVLNLTSFCSSLLGPFFYFYIYVSSSVLSYCSIKHDDDDDDDVLMFPAVLNRGVVWPPKKAHIHPVHPEDACTPIHCLWWLEVEGFV